MSCNCEKCTNRRLASTAPSWSNNNYTTNSMSSMYPTSYVTTSYTSLESAFSQWKIEFGKNYPTEAENAKRFQIWRRNHEYIEKHNSEYRNGKHTFDLGHNQFSDASSDEYLAFEHSNLARYDSSLKLKLNSEIQLNNYRLKSQNIPSHVDWREKGCVNPVQNQGICGSCYAFAALCAIEGQYFKKTGRLIKLSEQQVLDCSGRYGNLGCRGGTVRKVYNFVKDNGISTDQAYPYRGTAGVCKMSPNSQQSTSIKLSGYVELQGDEVALTQAVANIGPISVGINASNPSFQFYKSGYYYDPKVSPKINHSVVVVGYGSDGPGRDYYIVRNSWGLRWGESGYVKMARNRGNFAGIANQASYPTIADEFVANPTYNYNFNTSNNSIQNQKQAVECNCKNCKPHLYPSTTIVNNFNQPPYVAVTGGSSNTNNYYKSSNSNDYYNNYYSNSYYTSPTSNSTGYYQTPPTQSYYTNNYNYSSNNNSSNYVQNYPYSYSNNISLYQ